MTLDGVTFLRSKDVTNVSDIVQLFAGFLQCNGGKFEETSNYCVLESK